MTGEELDQLLAGTPEFTHRAERVGHGLRNPPTADLLLVADLRSRMEDLTARYDVVPSATMLGEAAEHLHQVSLIGAGATAGRVQRELHAVQAEAAVLMGQLTWDASQRRAHETVRAYYAQSLEVARHLRDPTAEGHALLRLCHVALYGANDPRQGLDLALRAAHTVSTTSHVLAGLALLHAAEAHAHLNSQSDCARALQDARRHLDNAEGADSAHELSTPTHFGRLAGSCYLTLGDYDRAQQLLAETAARLQGRPKSRAIVLGNLALAALGDRELDRALAAFDEAINELHGTRGGGGINVVFRAARELRSWRGEVRVQEAQDRLLTLMEAA